MWFAEYGDKIGRISTGGAITEFNIPTAGGHPEGIAAGPDGALWFTEYAGNKIGRISTGGAITEFNVPTAASFPYAIASGPDGALWFTEARGNNIGRITVAGVFTEYPLPASINGTLESIAAGPDGALWLTENLGGFGLILPPKIVRISLASSVPTLSTWAFALLAMLTIAVGALQLRRPQRGFVARLLPRLLR